LNKDRNDSREASPATSPMHGGLVAVRPELFNEDFTSKMEHLD